MAEVAGFDAMGEPVSARRKAQALEHLREMLPEGRLSTAEEMALVGRVAEAIERDRPFTAVQEAKVVLDHTGAYRLIAALCTG